MADPYIGEIRPFGCNYAPVGWAYCLGTQVSVRQNQALLAVIGTQFGGDGQNYINLPNLTGRVPMGSGSGPGLTTRAFASKSGAETITLQPSNMPQHNHNVAIEAAGGKAGPVTGAIPTSQFLATASFVATGSPTPELLYSKTAPNGNALASNTLNPVGGLPSGYTDFHENRQPYLAINFCIALEGLFPVRPE